MTRSWLWGAVAAAGLAVAGCGDDNDNGGAAAPGACTPPARATAFFHEDVHPVLTSRCTPCHADAWGSADRATAYAAARARVNTASPAQSVLIQKGDAQVTHGGGDRLDPEQVATITAWVRECAPNNSRTDPTPVTTTR